MRKGHQYEVIYEDPDNQGSYFGTRADTIEEVIEELRCPKEYADCGAPHAIDEVNEDGDDVRTIWTFKQGWMNLTPSEKEVINPDASSWRRV